MVVVEVKVAMVVCACVRICHVLARSEFNHLWSWWVCSCVHVLCIAHRNTSYTLVARSRIVSILIDFFPSLGFIMHLHKYGGTEVSDFSTSSCKRIGGKKSLHLITINWSLMAIKNSHSWCGAYSCRVCENAMQKINVSRGFFFQSFAMWMYTNELCVQFPIPCPCPCVCVQLSKIDMVTPSIRLAWNNPFALALLSSQFADKLNCSQRSIYK